MNEKISIIVPIYRVEKYIHRCVDSILNQTYHNLEIILVDDGSPDGCPAICDEYAKQDERVIVIHQKNQGLSAARNAGLDKASGKYIFFVDSDDFIEENVIKIMVESAEENNADLVLCNYMCVDEQGNELKTKYTKKLGKKVLNPRDVFAQSCEDGGAVFVVAWNKLYKRELWVDYRYPVGKLHEDEFVFCHIVSQCNTIISAGYTGYYYVQRDGSIMSSPSLRSCVDALDAYMERIDWYIENDMKLMAKNLFSLWYLVCADLYHTERNRSILKKYLSNANHYQKMIYETKVPIIYIITYMGLWYLPGMFSELLILYKKLWNMKKSSMFGKIEN